jgi:hypothetical protein
MSYHNFEITSKYDYLLMSHRNIALRKIHAMSDLQRGLSKAILAVPLLWLFTMETPPSLFLLP